MADLLIEIGCEDLPAGSVLPMAEHLGSVLQAALVDAELGAERVDIFATPRRIAARWVNVGERQPDKKVERRGPAMAAAYKDGEPSKALMGFLKSAGATVDDLVTVKTDKGEWVALNLTQPGKVLDDVINEALPDVLKTLPVPRRMRWADVDYEFLRPVSWLLAMHGERTLATSVLGLTASNVTYGHRFHAPEAVALSHTDDYEATLSAGRVMATFAERRDVVVSQVNALAATLSGTPVMDTDLVDEVTALVEWPVALAGQFEEQYLEIPKEALIQTMQENQRYFALLDNTGTLMPAFITVANIESLNPQTIVHGNERVIRPRFADTMFFWQQDKARRLEELAPELDRVLFQEKLGSVGDKVRRMSQLAVWLAPQLSADKEAVKTAVSLCKCDLVSEIVKELAKMQGIAGRYYALRDGHDASIAEAMEQHYFPKQSGGDLPAGAVSQCVSLADKVDTLVGIFGLGMKPTGTRDPFGLRRASIGILRILVEHQHDIDLAALFDQSLASYDNALPEADRAVVIDYVLERLRGYAQEQGFTFDAVDAVLAKPVTNPLDIHARLLAIRDFRKTDAAASLSAASKRIGNILKKAKDESGVVNAEVDTSQLVEPAEQALHTTLEALRPRIETQFAERQYQAAMTDMAELKEPVDSFFDNVMVMTDDAAVRANRQALLAQVNSLCSFTAELSRLQPQQVDA